MRLNDIQQSQGGTVIRTVLLLELIAFVACDPRITIRQIKSFVQSENVTITAIPKISVDVKTTRQFVGEKWYSPQTIATNTSDLPITITGVELFAEGTTFQNKPRVANYYPLNLSAHDTVALDVDFRLPMARLRCLRIRANCASATQANKGPVSHGSRWHCLPQRRQSCVLWHRDRRYGLRRERRL
jgi:hypothetical protein